MLRSSVDALLANARAEAATLRGLAVAMLAADASVNAAKLALDGAESRYAAGQLSFTDVDAARDMFVRATSARRRLGLEAAFSLARLRVWTVPRREATSVPMP